MDERAPWGPWKTLSWAVLSGSVFALAQALLAFALVFRRGSATSEGEVYAQLAALPHDGLFLALGTIAAAPVALAVLAFAIRRKGWTFSEYVELRRLPFRDLLKWLALAAAFAALCDGLTLAQGRPVVTDFARGAYATAPYKSLLWLALVGAAPVFEELFFRGFVFRGFTGKAAVWVPALYFAALHLQYDWWGLLQSLGMGLLFGWARLRSGTVTAPIAMHVLNNFLATLEAAVL
jgi:uncharacterized protein